MVLPILQINVGKQQAGETQSEFCRWKTKEAQEISRNQFLTWSKCSWIFCRRALDAKSVDFGCKVLCLGNQLGAQSYPSFQH